MLLIMSCSLFEMSFSMFMTSLYKESGTIILVVIEPQITGSAAKASQIYAGREGPMI